MIEGVSQVVIEVEDQARALAFWTEKPRSRGVVFPQPPVEQSFDWWSMFDEGNRFALRPGTAT